MHTADNEYEAYIAQRLNKHSELSLHIHVPKLSYPLQFVNCNKDSCLAAFKIVQHRVQSQGIVLVGLPGDGNLRQANKRNVAYQGSYSSRGPEKFRDISYLLQGAHVYAFSDFSKYN